MVDANSTQVLRNGFEVVTREQIQHFSIMGMEAAENLRTILGAIKRLATAKGDREVEDLAAMGKNIADGLHNDIDVIRECAEKAGIAGELVKEVCHG